LISIRGSKDSTPGSLTVSATFAPDTSEFRLGFSPVKRLFEHLGLVPAGNQVTGPGEDHNISRENVEELDDTPLNRGRAVTADPASSLVIACEHAARSGDACSPPGRWFEIDV